MGQLTDLEATLRLGNTLLPLVAKLILNNSEIVICVTLSPRKSPPFPCQLCIWYGNFHIICCWSWSLFETKGRLYIKSQHSPNLELQANRVPIKIVHFMSIIGCTREYNSRMDTHIQWLQISVLPLCFNTLRFPEGGKERLQIGTFYHKSACNKLLDVEAQRFSW